MLRALTRQAALAVVIAILVSMGCSQPHPSRPPRAKALDMFEDWVGTWEAEFEMYPKGMDTPMKCTGTSEITWEADKRMLLERFTMNMGEMGTMNGLAVRTYDPKSGKFREYWIDDWGSVAHGTMRYDEMTGKWHMKGENHSPMHGSTRYKGTAWKPDADTLKAEYSERPWWGFSKLFTASGTMHRK